MTALTVRKWIGTDNEFSLSVHGYLREVGSAEYIKAELMRWMKKYPAEAKEQLERLQTLVGQP